MRVGVMGKRLPFGGRWLGIALILVLASGCSRSSDVTIMAIQGKDHFSPLQGQTVVTSGVVTFVLADGEGFFIQDPAGDGDPATSDGVLVVTEGAPSGIRMPVVGDGVRVSGQVEELQFGKALPRTQVSGLLQLEIRSSGNPQPPTVALEGLPTESLTEGKAFWESREGMLVRVQNGLVVAPTSSFGEFAVLAESGAKPGSGFFAETSHILLRSLGDNEVDYNPERIQIAGEAHGRSTVVRPGDEVVELLGVVDYTYGNYKVLPSRIEVQDSKIADAACEHAHGT